MVTGHDPWPELHEPEDREQIKKLIIDCDFPDTDQLRILGNVIKKCWRTDFASMKEVERAVNAEMSLYISKHRETESLPDVSLSNQV